MPLADPNPAHFFRSAAYRGTKSAVYRPFCMLDYIGPLRRLADPSCPSISQVATIVVAPEPFANAARRCPSYIWVGGLSAKWVDVPTLGGLHHPRLCGGGTRNLVKPRVPRNRAHSLLPRARRAPRRPGRRHSLHCMGGLMLTGAVLHAVARLDASRAHRRALGHRDLPRLICDRRDACLGRLATPGEVQSSAGRRLLRWPCARPGLRMSGACNH